MTAFTFPTMTPFVDLHRTMIKQNQAMAHDLVEAQQTALDAAAAGMHTWQSLSRQQAAFARTLSNMTLDNTEAMWPGDTEGVDELRTLVDDQMTLVEEVGEESFDLTTETFEEGRTSFGEFAETSLEAFDASVDAYLTATEEVAATTEAVAESIEIE